MDLARLCWDLVSDAKFDSVASDKIKPSKALVNRNRRYALRVIMLGLFGRFARFDMLLKAEEEENNN